MEKTAGFEEIEQMAKNGTYLYDLKDQLKGYVLYSPLFYISIHSPSCFSSLYAFT